MCFCMEWIIYKFSYSIKTVCEDSFCDCKKNQYQRFVYALKPIKLQ